MYWVILVISFVHVECSTSFVCFNTLNNNNAHRGTCHLWDFFSLNYHNNGAVFSTKRALYTVVVTLRCPLNGGVYGMSCLIRALPLGGCPKVITLFIFLSVHRDAYKQ